MSDVIAKARQFASECWTNVFANASDSVVYIDRFAAECLHWCTAGKGYLALKDAGAIAVHELGMYHFRYAEVKGTDKAVVVSTAGDPAFYQRTIKMILAKNRFHDCTIYCGVPCCSTDRLASFQRETEGRLNYFALKKNIKSWMSANDLSREPLVDVVHVPLFLCFLSERLFVTPPFGDLMPPLDANISNDAHDTLDFLADSFHRLFDAINAKVDVYSIGKLSDYLAERLESYRIDADPGNQRTSRDSETGVSLVLIDRTLDLCTPASSNADSFLARILQTLPRLPCHNNDVAIGVSSMLGTIEGVQRPFQVPGCLASVKKSTMDLFVSENEKEALAMANRSLTDIIVSTEDSPKLRTPVRISGYSLEKMLDKIRTTKGIDFMTKGTENVQTILAIIEASTSHKVGQLELLTGLEKLALQNLSVSRESSSFLTQLSDVVRTRVHRGLDVENLLALLIHVYGLAGTQIRFADSQERCLEESIATAIFEDFLHPNGTYSASASASASASTFRRSLLLLLLQGTNNAATGREMPRKIAARIMDTLRLVAKQRSALQDYRFCMIKPSAVETIRRVSLLEQITRDILCTGIPRELKDLRRRSSSLVSAGFSLFSRGKTKRRPRDDSCVVIYVVGGIASEEAKTIHEITLANDKDKTNLRILLGGSRLLNPLDVVDKLFFN